MFIFSGQQFVPLGPHSGPHSLGDQGFQGEESKSTEQTLPPYPGVKHQVTPALTECKIPRKGEDVLGRVEAVPRLTAGPLVPQTKTCKAVSK